MHIYRSKSRTGKRKSQRPLRTDRPMHLVIKCRRRIFEDMAFVREAIFLSARKFQVPVCDYAISHDHVHFITKVPSWEAYVRFIRALTGRMALYFGKNLFQSIFTRIAESAFDYRTLLAYCQKNRDEALRSVHYPRRPPMFKKKSTSPG